MIPGREWVVTTRTAQQPSTRKAAQNGSVSHEDTVLRTYVLDTSVLLSDPQALFRPG